MIPAWCKLPATGIYARASKDARTLLACIMLEFAKTVALERGVSVEQTFNSIRELYEKGYLRAVEREHDDGKLVYGLVPCLPTDAPQLTSVH